MVTWFGLLGNIVAGALMALGHLVWGGIVMMLVVPLDALDGTMARLLGEDSKYGSLVDSVTDRYSEIAIFTGLLIHLSITGTTRDTLLVFFAMVGSIMVSYIRAKAESLGFTSSIGLVSRAERYLILVPGILFGFLKISLWILAIFGNLTALQRFLYVRKQAINAKNKKK
ncbi:MAG: CDP-alcohol phosphatidyltransferase family protein [Brevefilum sp.]